MGKTTEEAYGRMKKLGYDGERPCWCQAQDWLIERGVYVWIKPMLGGRVVYAAHAAWDGEHMNVGNYEDKDEARQAAVNRALDAMEERYELEEPKG